MLDHSNVVSRRNGWLVGVCVSWARIFWLSFLICRVSKRGCLKLAGANGFCRQRIL